MITGDYKETAFAIARKIGIADSIDQCMTGSEIDSLSPEVFRRKIPTYPSFLPGSRRLIR